MDLPHIIRDELLLAAEAQQQQHLVQILQAVEDETSVDSGARATCGRHATEQTPLLLQSPRGHHVVRVDLDKVEAILTAEEKEAIEADAKLSARAIVREEATALLHLSVPLVRSTR